MTSSSSQGPLSLLFVGTNRGGGGTESHFVTLARAMAAAGHDVSAAVWPDDVIHRALAADGRVRLFPIRFRRKKDLRATRDVLRAVRAVRPDWIVGSFKREYWPLAVVARATRTPLVLFSHLDQRMHVTMRLGLPPFVRAFVAPSAYQGGRLIARGIPAAKVHVLHNPVDVERFRPDPAARARARAELGVSPDDVVVAYVGRQERGKGVVELAQALEGAMDARADVRALWVGHAGDDATDLCDVVARSPHAARHLWRPWTADVAPYLNAADVVTLPSTGRETFGLVLVEAQACGVPVLGSRTGGIPETMDDGVTGLALPPGDVAAWRDAIVALAADADRRRCMGAAGRAFVARRFAAPAIAAAFAALLASLGQTRTKSPRR